MDFLKGLFPSKTSTSTPTPAKKVTPAKTYSKTGTLASKADGLVDKAPGLIEKAEQEVLDFTDPFDVENRKPMFSFLGFSELSILDLTIGFASGLYARDLRLEWHECLGGPLMMIKGLLKLVIEFTSQDFTNIIGVITNFVLLQHMVDLLMKIVKEAPTDLTACGGLYTETTETVDFVIKHINPATLLTNILANLVTHIVDLLGDLWKLCMALFAFDFYEMGRLSGEMTMYVIN